VVAWTSAAATTCAALWIAPYFYAHFNVLAGGSNQGWHWLGYSDIDWGQDLTVLRRWAKKHPEAKPLYVAYSIGWVDLNKMGLDALPASFDDDGRPTMPGWYAIFARRLIQDASYFQRLTPTQRPSPALLIFDLTQADFKSPAVPGTSDGSAQKPVDVHPSGVVSRFPLFDITP
jgi:hypothetical protein